MHRFDLKGADLAKKSGLSESQISKFRRGHNFRLDSLEKLLLAMPQEAREYMLSLIAQADVETDSLPPKSDDGTEPTDC